MKAAKSQQILPSDRKHLDPVAIGAHQDGGESAVLAASQRLAEDALRQFT